MAEFPLGNVVALIKHELPPDKTYVLWGKILNPMFPDVVELHYYNGSTWVSLNSSAAGVVVENILLADLQTLVIAETLETHKIYRVTDYEVTYDKDDVATSNTVSGDILLFRPQTPAILNPIVISEDNPTDFILFDIATGKMLYRKDCINNNSAHFDFRPVVFTRWANPNTGENTDPVDTGGADTDIPVFGANVQNCHIGAYYVTGTLTPANITILDDSYNIDIKNGCNLIGIGESNNNITIEKGCTLIIITATANSFLTIRNSSALELRTIIDSVIDSVASGGFNSCLNLNIYNVGGIDITNSNENTIKNTDNISVSNSNGNTWDYLPDSLTLSSISNTTYLPGYSNIPATIDISGLTTFQVPEYAGRVLLTSTNPTETINTITYAGAIAQQFTIEPATGLAITLDTVSVGVVGANEIISNANPASDIALVGDNYDIAYANRINGGVVFTRINVYTAIT